MYTNRGTTVSPLMVQRHLTLTNRNTVLVMVVLVMVVLVMVLGRAIPGCSQSARFYHLVKLILPSVINIVQGDEISRREGRKLMFRLPFPPSPGHACTEIKSRKNTMKTE